MMAGKWLLRIVWILFCLAVPMIVLAQSVGEICAVKGDVKLKRAGKPGGGQRAPQRDSAPASKGAVSCKTYDPVHAGDMLEIGAGGWVKVLYWESGAIFSVQKPGVVRVERNGLKQGGKSLKAARRVTAGFLRPLRTGQTFREEGLGLRLSAMGRFVERLQNPSPVGAARDTSVVLRWEGADADSLRITLQDRANKQFLLDRPLTRGKESIDRYSIAPKVLTENGVYRWHVEGGGKGCEGVFRVLTMDEKHDLEMAETGIKELRSQRDEDGIADRILAQIYSRFGLWNEALAAYRLALKVSPQDEGLKFALERTERSLREWTGQKAEEIGKRGKTARMQK